MPSSPGQIITLPVGSSMRMDWKKRASWANRGPLSYRQIRCATPGRAPKHTPITTATMRLNASRWYSLGLVFIAISRLASLRAESHIDLLKVLGQA